MIHKKQYETWANLKNICKIALSIRKCQQQIKMPITHTIFSKVQFFCTNLKKYQGRLKHKNTHLQNFPKQKSFVEK